jgi:hypothetical protein
MHMLILIHEAGIPVFILIPFTACAIVSAFISVSHIRPAGPDYQGILHIL